MRELPRLLYYARPYLSGVAKSVISNILLSIFTVVSIPLVIPFFQILFQRTPPVVEQPVGYHIGKWLEYGFSTLIKNTDRDTALLYVCLAIILVFFFKNLFRYLALYYIAPVRNGIVRDIRDKIYRSFMDAPLSFFTERQKGDLISRTIADVQEIEWSILNVVEAVFKSPLIIVGSVALMIYISPALTQFVFVLIIFTIVIIGGIGKSLKKTSAKAQSSIGRITSTLEETLGGMKIVRAFRAQEYLSSKFHRENTNYKDTLTGLLRRRDMSSPLTEFLGIAVVVALLLYGAAMVFKGSLNPESFFAFIFAFYQVIEPSKALSSAYYNILKGLAAMERIEAITERSKVTQERNILKNNFTGKIRFEDVSFVYPGTEIPVLKCIDLEIRFGEKIAFVGASGSGKTTLIDLLLGFYKPTKGRISIDGVDISTIAEDSLFSIFGLVTQHPVLFNDTVRNNILFGEENPAISVEEAAIIANANEFIRQLPQGFDTNIGDSGVKLSGGQRQRLTLARAILRNPPILVLDEATSSLDSESELLVQEALKKMLKNRTAVIIAHRLSTIKDADRIVVMKDGCIEAVGTHEELIKTDGDYNKFVVMQNILD